MGRLGCHGYTLQGPGEVLYLAVDQDEWQDLGLRGSLRKLEERLSWASDGVAVKADTERVERRPTSSRRWDDGSGREKEAKDAIKWSVGNACDARTIGITYLPDQIDQRLN
ncbi:hypothetical protein B0H11DRAFT_1933137 [Mycena galericulata]|nr:hypothetical protein B0H11DRAFT_1933137 [Mycena galericulata]